MERLLIVDDDVELCELVTEYLRAEGFDLEAVYDGERGVERGLSAEHALIILDVMLPALNGFEVLRRLRAASRIPVLMLTARGEDLDRIIGLEIGADDYLAKPFNPRELAARIRAILRRANPEIEPEKSDAPERLRVGDVEIDAGARVATCAGEILDLTAVEFDLLCALLRAAGRVVAREELARNVLGRALTPFDRSIDMHVSHLRRKLGQRADGTERIKTVRGAGYIYTTVISDE
ncbi:MAG: response regulator [Pyrinomonadaceae bacterium]|nr:response regulator [Pyrinomonadaceae bacterium]